MPRIVRTEREKRGFFGNTFKWIFIIFNILMATWFFAGFANIGDVIERAGSEAERAGAAVGSTVGLGIILFFWAAGAAILGMLALITRGSKKVVLEDINGFVLLLLAATASASPGMAADLPRWDAHAQCENQLRSIGQPNNSWLMKGCLEQEQRAYDTLKAAWPKLPDEISSICKEQISTIGQSSYWLLNACVEQQVQARSEVGSFKFRY